MNPIENIWAQMEKKIQRANLRPRNEEELRQIIVETWNNVVTPELCRTVVASMPRRLQEVVARNGNITKY